MNETQFRECVKLFVQVDDSIKEKAKEMKSMRTQKKEFQDMIEAFMLAQDLNTVSLRDGGKIVLKKRKRSSPLNKDCIREGLLKIFNNDADTVDNALEVLQAGRVESDVTSVTRLAARKRKAGEISEA